MTSAANNIISFRTEYFKIIDGVKTAAANSHAKSRYDDTIYDTIRYGVSYRIVVCIADT